MSSGKKRVAIIGSGNWGSAAARLVALNVQEFSDEFEETVNMWVFEEEVEGEKLSEIINTRHENVKYLPEVTLPENLVAVPDLMEAVEGANCLVFVLPHQFIPKICTTLKESNLGEGVNAISLIKGLDIGKEGPIIISEMIGELLGFECCALSGANIANEIARDKFAEATIGYHSKEVGELYQKLFHRKMFRVNIVPDVTGVQLCGALKNIVAIAAGFSDGLSYGSNTKSALMRIGMMEMKKYSALFFGEKGIQNDTLLESAGVADLITTCFNGRNRRCAEQFALHPEKGWDEIEKEQLNGQKLQGTLTLKEVVETLDHREEGLLEKEFPLFYVLHQICFNGLGVDQMIELL